MIQLHNDNYVFLESFNFSSRSEMAENLVEVIEQSRTLAGERFNVNLYADNASNMMAMGRRSNL